MNTTIEFRFATSIAEHGVSDLEDIKLFVILRGILHISTSMSIKKVIVESDCLLMVKKSNAGSRFSSKLGNLVTESKRL